MTQYDCTCVKILKASLSFSSCLRTVCFLEEFLEIVITEEIYAFLEMNFIKIVYMGGLCIRADVVFLCYFSLGKNRHIFILFYFF